MKEAIEALFKLKLELEKIAPVPRDLDIVLEDIFEYIKRNSKDE